MRGIVRPVKALNFETILRLAVHGVYPPTHVGNFIPNGNLADLKYFRIVLEIREVPALAPFGLVRVF